MAIGSDAESRCLPVSFHEVKRRLAAHGLSGFWHYFRHILHISSQEYIVALVCGSGLGSPADVMVLAR